MRKYRQISTKISCSDYKELTYKINSLGAVGDMPITIQPTIPNSTDTKQWYSINYWVINM